MADLITTWVNGASALTLVISAWIFTFLCVSYYKTYKSKPFRIGFPLGLAVAFGWTGITITFLSVAILGYNLPWVKDVIGYFSYSTIPVGAFSIISVTWEVASSPQSKNIALALFGAFSIFYYICLYTTFSQGVIVPAVPAGEIYDDYITPAVPFYYVVWAEVLFAAVITGVGFTKFRSLAPGALRQKSTYLILASIIVAGSILWDTVIFFGWITLTLFIPRLLMILGLALIFGGFKPIREEAKAQQKT